MEQQTMETLKIEEQELIKKMQLAREKGDYGTYKNLVNALERILTIQERQINKTMWSKYKIVKQGKEIDVISVWEQCGDNIKNHKAFEIVGQIDTEKKIIDITDYVTDVYECSYGTKGEHYHHNLKTLGLRKVYINKNIFEKYLDKVVVTGEKIVLSDKIYSVTNIDKVVDEKYTIVILDSLIS